MAWGLLQKRQDGGAYASVLSEDDVRDQDYSAAAPKGRFGTFKDRLRQVADRVVDRIRNDEEEDDDEEVQGDRQQVQQSAALQEQIRLQARAAMTCLEQEQEQIPRYDGELRIFEAKICPPQDLSFVVPEGCRHGQIVVVSGPHCPIGVAVPQGAEPGAQVSVRLGPNADHVVAVPKDARPGDEVKFEGTNGEDLIAYVPQGKEPGDFFEVLPRVVMVQVPRGARAGDHVEFNSPYKSEEVVRACIPESVGEFHYFAAKV